jgi:hypothetical protein
LDHEDAAAAFCDVLSTRFDAIHQAGHVEVDDEAHWQLRQPQICDQLCFVDRSDGIHALDLHDDGVVDNQVDPIVDIDPDTLVGDGNGALDDEPKTSLGHLVLEAGRVDRFEQAWTKRSVNLYRRT